MGMGFPLKKLNTPLKNILGRSFSCSWNFFFKKLLSGPFTWTQNCREIGNDGGRWAAPGHTETGQKWIGSWPGITGWVLQKQMLRWFWGCKVFIRKEHQWKEGLGGRIGQKKKFNCDTGLIKPWLAWWESLEQALTIRALICHISVSTTPRERPQVWSVLWVAENYSPHCASFSLESGLSLCYERLEKEPVTMPE